MSKVRTRFVAFDLRPQRFGYVVFELPIRLLDWGTGTYESDSGKMRETRLGRLLQMFQPSTVVLRRISIWSRRNRPATRKRANAIRAEAGRRSIPSEFVQDKVMRAFFHKYSKRNKHEIASFVATCFPELKWKLPDRRKAWETEDWRMPVFDAAALGLTHISRVDAEAIQHLLGIATNSFAGPSVAQPNHGPPLS